MKMTISRAALAAASVFSLVAVAGPTLAAKMAGGPMSAIHQFIDDFNKGDMAGAKAAHVDAPTIIDEVAPYMWSGSGAVDAWAADLVKDAKANGDTDNKVRLGRVLITHAEADKAYVHLNADYLYREHMKSMVEHGGFTFALTRDGGDWKIAGWSWNGTAPQAIVEASRQPATAPKAAPAAKPKI
jgi:hypothetical protein